MDKDIVGFNKLFLDQLSDIYNAEQQLVQALPKVAMAASSSKLRDAITAHLKETKNQVARLEKIFHLLGETPEQEVCEAMAGLVEETNECIAAYPASALRDAAIIACAQCIEHYEMAIYGTLRTFAKELDLKDIARLLQDSLDEEGNANKTLNGIAEGGFFTAGVNQKALKC